MLDEMPWWVLVEWEAYFRIEEADAKHREKRDAHDRNTKEQFRKTSAMDA